MSRNRDLIFGTVLLGIFFHFFMKFADSITFPVRLAALFSRCEYNSRLVECISYVYSFILTVVAVILCILVWTVLTGLRICEQGKHIELTDLLKDTLKNNWAFFMPVIVMQQCFIRTMTFAHHIARSGCFLFVIPAFIKEAGGVLFGIGCVIYSVLIFVFLSQVAECKALGKDCSAAKRICFVLLMLVSIMMLPMFVVILSGIQV